MPVEVIEPSLKDYSDGSGSGESDMLMNNPTTTMSTSGADIADFKQLTTESVGQLYAYRYSNTSFVLATRSASGSIGNPSEDIQMTIGLSPVADGVYICVAENYPNRSLSGISNITVNINTMTRELYMQPNNSTQRAYCTALYSIQLQHLLHQPI